LISPLKSQETAEQRSHLVLTETRIQDAKKDFVIKTRGFRNHPANQLGGINKNTVQQSMRNPTNVPMPTE